jgi:hypothetical protein
MIGIKQYFKDAIEGFKMFCKKDFRKAFWRDFRHYYSEKEICRRLNAFAERLKK